MAIALGSLLAGAIYTWFAGEDVNWDWQNYHEYNVWAVINGRYGLDALPAGFQTYFNPTVYFPVYYLRHLLPLPYGLMILGAVHGLNLLLIYFLIRVLLREAATASAIGASILIAAVGPMTLSEVGTSFSDILTALPILAGCILILSADGSRHGRYVLAGLLIGAAVGLKLTNVVYALGAAAAVLVAVRPLPATLCLGVGGAIGAVTSAPTTKTGEPVTPWTYVARRATDDYEQCTQTDFTKAANYLRERPEDLPNDRKNFSLRRLFRKIFGVWTYVKLTTAGTGGIYTLLDDTPGTTGAAYDESGIADITSLALRGDLSILGAIFGGTFSPEWYAPATTAGVRPSRGRIAWFSRTQRRSCSPS